MPIYSIGNNHAKELHFGAGDIQLAAGVDKKNKGVGMLVFIPCYPPLPSGTTIDYPATKDINVNRAPVRMYFSDTTSIDQLMQSLDKIKKHMIGAQQNEKQK